MLKTHLMSSLAVATLVLASPALSQEHDPLRIVTSFDIESMNPFVEGFWMQEFGVAELLIKFEADGGHYPWLLSDFEPVDDTTWVLTVREGVTFQNGKPLDAQAVLDAIELQLANSTSSRGAVPQSAAFEVTGEYEITVTTDAPWPSLPGVLANESVFLIFDAEAVEAAGEDWASLVGAGIYTGPYSVTTLDRTELVAERFDQYWQGDPALPGLSVSFVPDPNARILAVQNNEADIALYPPNAAYAVVEATPGLHFVAGTPGTGGFMGFFNVNEPPFDEVAVRQAFMKAIDYQHIASTVFRDLRAPATGLYNSDFEWALENYQTDIEEAARLLDEADWVVGSDGRRSRDGVPLEITMLIYPQQPDLVPLTNDVQAQLNRLGITSSIQMVDDIYAGLLEGTVDWDIGISSEGTVSWGITEGFLNRYLASGGNRNFGYSNPKIDALISELTTTTDPEDRNAILAEIQTILVEEDPYVFAFTIHKGAVVVNDLYRDYQPGFALYHVSWQTAPAEDGDEGN